MLGITELSSRQAQLQRALGNPRFASDPVWMRDTARKYLRLLRDGQDRGSPRFVTGLLWEVALVLKRLEKHRFATKALARLHQDLERVRATITRADLRAGFAGEYRHLFEELCENYHALGDGASLLSSIEASKSRHLADATASEDAPIADIRNQCAGLPALCAEHGIHYLTYFVGEEATFAVLVSKEGELCILPRLDFTRPAAEDMIRRVDPRKWVQRSFFDPPVEPVDQAAELLLDGLERIESRAEPCRGDHILISPSGPLFNLPFHFVKFRGERLADWFTCSKIHGVGMLLRVLRRSASTPRRRIAIVCPLATDPPEFLSELEHSARSVASWGGVEAPPLTNPTVETVLRADLSDAVVHFACHGYVDYDQQSAPEAPAGSRGGRSQVGLFRSSGLVMATPEGLAKLADVEADTRAILSPSVVAQGPLRARGSHLTMQACTSGVSRTGRGGDAIGLEWAFMLAGAESVLGTHWNVDVRLATEFTDRFYERWLDDHTTKVQAWADAIRSMREQYDDDPWSWAAFSLVGDWR